MLTFLFWNLTRENLNNSITRLARLHNIDVIILAEFECKVEDLLYSLNGNTSQKYHYARSIGCGAIHVFTSFSAHFLKPLNESDRLSIRKLCLPGRIDIILAMNHFPSKLYFSEDSQALECCELSSLIRETENRIGHSRTILIGDLNMNPFETGMVSANGLNAVMCKNIAGKAKRKVQGKEYPFFYNPMWGCFGDMSPGPPGTYYYARAEHKLYYWNIFDQVLIRPELLDRFNTKNLRIIDNDGEVGFLDKENVPAVHESSDHLPLLFGLNI